MANLRIEVDSKELIKWTSRLDKLHRSALPIAVRNTLNKSAFDTRNDALENTKKDFVNRNKTFFRSIIAVEKAVGFDINSMQSATGLNNKKNINENVSKQETGGEIRKRSLIPMDSSRVSNNKIKGIKKKNWLKNISSIKGKDGFLLLRKSGKGTLFAVGRKRKLMPLYSFKENRSVKIKKKPFIQPAAFKASKRMNEVYVNEALKQINKYMR